MKSKDDEILPQNPCISTDSALAIMSAYSAVELRGIRDGWDENFQDENFRHVLDLVKRCRAVPADSTLLDVGCGTGKLAQVWSDYGGQQYIGVDILSPDMSILDRLMQVHPDFQYINGEFTRLNLPPADFVIASGSLTIGSPEDKYVFFQQYLAKMLKLARKGIYFNYWEDTGISTVSPTFLDYDSRKIDGIIARLMENYGFKKFHREQRLYEREVEDEINNHVFIQKAEDLV